MFDTERFILEVQQRGCIWNAESPLYYNRDVKRDAWIEIYNTMFGKRGKTFQELNPTEQIKKIDSLQKKWKNIRDHFKKCRRLVHPSSVTSSKVIKPYMYSDILQFLVPVLEGRRTDISAEFEETSIEELNEQIMTDEDNNDDSLTILPICEVRQKRNCDDLLEPTKRLKETYGNDTSDISEDRLLKRRFETIPKDDEDPDKLFLLSLLPQIRPLTNDQKNFLYIEILQSIQKAKYFKHPIFTMTENKGS